MRKQITIPDNIDEILKSLSKKSNTSESNIVSFALIRLKQDYTISIKYTDGGLDFIHEIKKFYVDYFCKKLPRGLKAKGGKNA